MLIYVDLGERDVAAGFSETQLLRLTRTGKKAVCGGALALMVHHEDHGIALGFCT